MGAYFGEGRRTEGEWKGGRDEGEGKERREGRRGEGICQTNVKLLPTRL